MKKGKKSMGTAQVQGALWSAGAQDWARYHEQMHLPAYMAVFAALDLKKQMSLLDVGCGTGLAALLAAQQVAHVAGIDASSASIAIARERVPEGNFIVGEMEELPYPDKSFDVVMGCSSFPYAQSPLQALKEAARVVRPQGKITLLVWGPEQECEHATTLAAVSACLPPDMTRDRPGPFALSEPGKLETLLEEAGLTLLESGNVACPFFYSDEQTALRAICASGVVVEAIRSAGEEPVREAIRASLQPYRIAGGAIYQRNTFRYAIAAVAASSSHVECGPQPIVAQPPILPNYQRCIEVMP
jgi:SAM-dependent methyltransferase